MLYDVHREPNQLGGEFSGIADSGGTADEDRIGAVEVGQSTEPAEHIADMAPEDAAQHMYLVHDHITESSQEGRPPPVPGEDPDVQHVRVGEEHIGMTPCPSPGLVVGIAVVDGRHHLGHPEIVQRAELVPAQCLCGEQQQ